MQSASSRLVRRPGDGRTCDRNQVAQRVVAMVETIRYPKYACCMRMSVQFTRGRVDIGVMSDALANVVARSVRAERARRGLSQSELGALLGWSQTKVSQVESGARRLYAHELPE